ncbi:MAG: phosphotransacetylase family protein [Chloroflexi bacterium]|nr:phosphotransacetylase family protein [Chloroflexota bacterium]
MTAVLLVGVGQASGKSALAVALGKRLQREGRRVGYLKPVFGTEPADSDADAVFLRSALQVRTPVAQLAPFMGPLPVARDQTAAVQERLKAAYADVAAGTDAVLVELPGALGDAAWDPVAVLVAEALEARVVPVVRYWQEMDGATIATRLNRLKARTVGVVVNSVPRKVLPVVRPAVAEALAGRGYTLLGVLPEDRTLVGFSIAEVAAHLDATFLTGQEQAGGLIENLLLQANPADPLSTYVQHKPNRLVIVRVDRPDLQLAAMDTEPRGLLLTGPGRELPNVLYRAEDEGIPMLRVALTTKETIAALAGLVEGVRFRQEEKVPRIVELVDQHLDLAPLLAALTPAAETADRT